MKQSSSSLREEDVPLKQRVKAKTQNLVKKAKKEVRKNTVPVQPNSKKFVIPRNKKTRELLDIQGLESRDAIEILRKIKQSFYQPDTISNYMFEDVTIVHNARFNTEFSAKKQEMRQDGYAQKDLEDTFAYLYLDGWHKVRKMAKEGLRVGSSSFSSLGDPKMGIYVSRFPDVVLPHSIPVRSSKYLMVFKIAKGKLKAVGERTGDGCALEPTPNYDGHISKSFPPAHNVSLEQTFTSSQYYFYEFADDGDDLHARRPRQCCPYAVIQFSVTSSQSHSSSRNVLTQDSSLRNIPSHESRNVSAQLVPSRNEKNNNDVVPLICVKSMVDGQMYANYSKHGRTLWSGVLKNKENILSSADLICYSSDILPITIGGNIDIKGKVSFEKLRPLLLLPIFKQLPAISTKCKAFDQGMMYLYCEVRPRDKNNAKLAKLIKFFQQKNLAGVAEYAESSAHMYIIPTSGFSHELGLTDRHYPNMLHALILKKLPKEDIQSYKKMNKMTADSITEAAVRRDIRKELRRIEIEKLKKREQSESSSRASSDMEISSSDDRAESDAERKKTDVKDKDAGVNVEVAVEKEAVDVEVKQNDSESTSKDTDDSMKILQSESSSNVPVEKYQETNVLSAVSENVDPAATSKDSDKASKDMENSPNKNNQQKMVDADEVFKSPPPIQKHAAIVDDENNVPTNTVTRHFMDPRLGWKADRFLLASPTEIEPLSSDSGADTPEPSPILKYSRTNETSPAVVPQSQSVLHEGDSDEGTETTVVKTDKTSSDKDKVSRLSSRLMALFSQTGKRPAKSTTSIETTASPVTSTVSSGTPTTATVTVSSSLSVESQNVATESPSTTSTYKLQTATPPSSIPSSAPSAPSSFPSAGDSNVSSACVATMAGKDMTRGIDLLSSTTYATPSQTSSYTLGGSRMYPYTAMIHGESYSNPRGENLEGSPRVSPMPSQQSAITSSAFSSYATVSNSTTNYSTSLNTYDSESPLRQMFDAYPPAEASPEVSSIPGWSCNTYSAPARDSPVLTATGSFTPSPGSSNYSTFNTEGASFTECETSQLSSTVQAKVGDLSSSDRLACPVTSIPSRTTANTSEWTVPNATIESKPLQNLKPPLFTSNTYLNEIVPFLQNKTTSPSTTAVTFLVSPSTSSSPASTVNVSDSGGSLMAYSYKPQMTTKLSSSNTFTRYDQQVGEDYQRNDWEVNQTLREDFPQGNDPQKVQTSLETTQDSGSDHVPAFSTSSQTPAMATSYETYSSGTVSIPRAVNTPPLPTEALPPPPPPPLTSSFSTGYIATYSGSRNKDSLSYLTPISTERGQDSTDLYEYGLTLSSVSGQATTQDGSDSYFCEGNMSSGDSSRSSTPVIPMQEKQLKPGSFPQYSPTSTPPPPPPLPPPPPPPLLCGYNTPMFHQENYSTTYSPFYTHPYSGIQPIPNPNPTLSEYHYHAPGNTGYPNFPSALTKDFDSTAGFGYTKQITPLWNKSSAVRSNEDQSLATKDLDQHKHSKRVAEMPSEKVADIKSTPKQDKSSFAKYLKSREKERRSSKSIEKKSSSSKERSEDSSDITRDTLKQKESSGSPSSQIISTISSDLEIQKDISPTPESSSYVDEYLSGTIDNLNVDGVVLSASSFKPATRDEHVVTETGSVIPNSQAIAEQQEFANGRQVSEKTPAEEYLAEDSGTEQHIQYEDAVSPSEIPNRSDEGKQDIGDLEIEQSKKQTPSPSSGNHHTVEQRDSVTPSNNSSVNQEWQPTFTETNFANHSVTAMRDDAVDSSLDIHVSNVSEYLDSNDETYEDIPLSDNETICNEAHKKSKRAKVKKDKNQKTEVKCGDGVRGSASSSDVSIRTLSEYVDSNDDTFVEIPLLEKEIGMTPGFDEGQRKELSDDEWQIESYSDPGREINTGRKREGVTDLRELIQEKKRKLAAKDSEKHVPPRNRRRVVEIVRCESDVPEDSTQTRSQLPDETLRKVTSPDPDSNLIIPERINIVLENRRKMTSPDLGSPFSTPDRSEAFDETRQKISSPDFDKRRKSSSPESESRARSPDWNRNEHRRLYSKRRAGSSDGSRAGSSAGSRPGSSASSRIGCNVGSRPGSSASLQTGSNVSLRAESNTKRYPPRKRSRMENENPDKTREEACSRSSRGLVEDYPTNLPARGIDEDYSQNSPAGSRHERQRSISPSESNYNYVTERDNLPSIRLSPARESRYRSRYSIKRHDARSSSNDSCNYRTRNNDRNNNWSRHDERPDVDSRTKSQIDFSDETVLSKLANLDVIERLQHYVNDNIRRTFNEMPGCLDEPVEKDEREEQQPFFGGIGEYIYAQRDEEESRHGEDREYRSGSEMSRRAGRSRTEESGDYHGEGAAADTKSGINSQSLGCEAKRNIVQKDVMNNIFKNDFVNVKQSEVSVVYKCTERDDVIVSTPGSTQNNQTTSDVLSQAFIAQFKVKRRRLLLEQLRNLRGKEKIGSCAIILTQLEKLKRDVRKLSAAKLRRGHGTSKNTGHKENKNQNNSKNNEVVTTQDPDHQLDKDGDRSSVKDVARERRNSPILKKSGLNSTNQETTAKVLSQPGLDEPGYITVDDGSVWNIAGDSSDYDVISMETSDSGEVAHNNRLKRCEEMRSRQLSTNDAIQMQREISSAFNQDSMKQTDPCVADCDDSKSDQQSLNSSFRSRSTKPRLKSNDAGVDGNTVDRRKKQESEGRVEKTSHGTQTFHLKTITDVLALKPSNITPPKSSITTSTGRNKGIETSKGTKDQVKENSLLRSREEDGECMGVRNREDIESTQRNIQDDNIPEHFGEACEAEQTDERSGPSSAADFDFIAQQAKCEFKVQLMIKSQELFPKQVSGFPVADHKSQHKSTVRQDIHKKGNNLPAKFSGNVETRNTSGKGVTKPKGKGSRTHYNPTVPLLDLPVNQPSQDSCQSRQSLEEQNFERQLSNVLNNLTKSQLDILQSGSPRARAGARLRGQLHSQTSPRSVDSTNI